MAYELFSGCVRGAAHIKMGIPCEDYGVKVDRGEYKIFAAADGHGDPRCARSGVGSRLVCEIAVNDLEQFVTELYNQECEESLFNEQEARRLMLGLAGAITTNWRDAVRKHLEENPLTSDEQDAIGRDKGELCGIEIEQTYGTTLIAGLLTQDYLLLLQQGDGRCVVFDCNGNASQPIPWDERCEGNVTTSMCDTDAIQSFRYRVINLKENPIVACVAGTDGVEDSFPSSDKLHAYYRMLFKYACDNGVDVMEKDLADELADLSSRGSMDDITISGVIDVERMKEFLEQFEQANKAHELEDKLAELDRSIRDIELGGRYESLRQRYERAQAGYDRADEEYRQACRRCALLDDKIAAHEEGASLFNGTGRFGLLFRRWLSHERCGEIIQRLILTDEMIAPLKNMAAEAHDTRESLRLLLEQECKKELEQARGEYFPYRERYEQLVREREKVRLGLESLR